MKTYIADIIPKIQRFSKKLDDLTLLTNQHWVSLSEILTNKTVYIFRPNNQLLISENGMVRKGSWDYLGNQSLLIDADNQSYLLKQGFLDENVIALKLDGSEQFAFFVNETKYDGELNNIHDVLNFLESKYLRNTEADKLRFVKKDRLGNIIVPSYTETKPVEHFQLFDSNFYSIIISFDDGLSGTIFKRKSDNKYYHSNNFQGERFFSNKMDCIQDLYFSQIQNH